MPPILPALAEEIRDRSNGTLHGHLQTTGSQPIMFDGLPNLRFPEAPGIRNAPTLRQRPDDAETPWAEFHLPTTANVPTADSRSSRRKRRSSYRPAAMSSVATASAALCTSRGMSERGFDTLHAVGELLGRAEPDLAHTQLRLRLLFRCRELLEESGSDEAASEEVGVVP